MYTEEFITERTYLKGVSPATVQWYRSSFKAFEGALGSKQAIVERIGTLRERNSTISVNTYLRCINAYFRWLHQEYLSAFIGVYQRFRTYSTSAKPRFRWRKNSPPTTNTASEYAVSTVTSRQDGQLEESSR